MTKLGFSGLLVSAALMASVQLTFAWAEDAEDSGTPKTQPPAATTPAEPGDSQDMPEDPDDQREGFDRYGPGCPYEERDLEPLLV